jgi:hypothetical protein
MPRLGVKALGLAATIMLAGCGSGGNFTYRQYAGVMGQGFKAMFSRGDVSRETAAAIPYASMGYRLNGGDEAILVLATGSDDGQLWTAASHVVLQTRGGRITQTVGLPHDLGGLASQQNGALPPLAAALQAPFSSARLADFPQIAAYGVPVACVTAAQRQENVSILGQSIATMRVDENCNSSGLNWRFVNSYWLDPKTGFAWRSLQHISPDGETVETEIFRPPG